jgi:hypothetical protein
METITNQKFNKATDCVICKEFVEPYTGAYTTDGFLAHKRRSGDVFTPSSEKDCYSECPSGVRQDTDAGEEWLYDTVAVCEETVRVATARDVATAAQICRDHNQRRLLIDALREMVKQFYRHTCKRHGPMTCDKCEALNKADAAVAAAAKGGPQ